MLFLRPETSWEVFPRSVEGDLTSAEEEEGTSARFGVCDEGLALLDRLLLGYADSGGDEMFTFSMGSATAAKAGDLVFSLGGKCCCCCC